MMPTKYVGPNAKIVTFTPSIKVFYSYDEPVAGYIKRYGFWSLAGEHSPETTDHISKYVKGRRRYFQVSDVDVIDEKQMELTPLKSGPVWDAYLNR